MVGAWRTAAGLAALAVAAAPPLDPLDAPADPAPAGATAPLVAVATADGVAVAVGPRGRVLRSDDGGLHWTPATVPASVDLTAVHLAPGGRGLAVGHDGLVLATEDGGRTWSRRLDGRGLAALLRARPPGCAGGAAAPAPASDAPEPGGAALRIACEQGAALSLLSVWVGEDGRGLAVGAFGLALWTDDGGRTWSPWLDRVDDPRARHLYAVGGAGDEVLAVGEQGVVLRLDRAAGRLVRVPAPAGGSLFGLAARGREVLAFGLAGRVLRSGDAGASWVEVASGVQDALVGGAALPDGRFVLVSARGALVASRDGGRSFRPLAAAPAPAAALAPAPAGALLVAGGAGVFRALLPGGDR